MTHPQLSIVRQEAIGEEPITLTMAKHYLRLHHDQEDSMLLGMIAAVRQTAEAYTNRSWIKTRYTIKVTLPWQEEYLTLPHKNIELDAVDVHEHGRRFYTLLADEYSLDTQSGTLTSRKLQLAQGWLYICYMLTPPSAHLTLAMQTMLQHLSMLYERGMDGVAETSQLQAWYRPLRTYTL
jgi:hypothetical protein